jgi:hypothetical protein
MDALIRQAIHDKRVIEFMYNGFRRIAEPHIYGRKDGVLQILAYQIGGQSSKGGLPEWRRFDFPMMLNLQLTADSFLGAREYQARHSAWDQKFMIVTPP